MTELGVESFYISRLLQEFLHTLSITLPPTKQETNILINTEQGLKIQTILLKTVVRKLAGECINSLFTGLIITETKPV